MYYDYICDNCNYEEVINHPMSEDPEILCPKCETILKRKITGGAATHFKGEGWASNENSFRGDYSKVKKQKMTKRIEGIQT